MLTVYGDSVSGNCYKIQLLASLLDIDINWVELNILDGDTQKPDFLALNPLGKIPLLQTDDGFVLSESNAILHFLADGHEIAGKDVETKSQVLQWQFFEQYSHEPYIAVARFINFYLGLPEEKLAEYLQKQEGGHKALAHMEQQLQKTPFLVGEQLSLADISLYAYTHVAHQGGFELDKYPAIQAWITRIEAQENYRPMGPKANKPS
ncbi:glutathione S-transferase family protein [Thalassotalea sp. PS06]|uniref:glutathione S-transferase family protein n=1 Tax=Thalassotalea sp. PS06 TaxID=2594005 RepID=UPI001163AF8E|nr:glutathione S-transferase family protein [Thalassotalea sp. PS06]QDP01230.1 glutathione S-transferase family protein [Thalassotalea sp. PS06]